MNGQRSETGLLNRCTADWEKSYSMGDADCRCDVTNTATGSSGTHAQQQPRYCRRLVRHSGRGEEESCDGDCRSCGRTVNGGDTGSSSTTATAGTCHTSLSCACRCRDPRCLNAGTGIMAGRLSAQIPADDAATSTWRKAKGIPRSQQRYQPWSSITSSSSPSESSAASSALPRKCLTWMSSRMCHGKWMVYLICYLVLLSSSWSVSQALEHPRQSHPRSGAAANGAKTAEDYLQRNFPEKFNKTDGVWSGIGSGSSYMRNRVRLGRAGGKYRLSPNYSMKMINKETARATCQPRDTVVDSYEELNIPKGYNIRVFPECIVVRRCKNGGCCRDDQECVPRSNGMLNVTKTFLINAEIERRPIVEYTECECVEKPDFCLPPATDCPNRKTWSYGQCGCVCRQRCPKPFLQDEATCACDCLMNNRVCKNIQRGRKDLRLSEEECQCVRGGMCETPNCVNGRFSLTKCKCVQPEHNQWS